jgi:rhodanese-related sulfurtransferase
MMKHATLATLAAIALSLTAATYAQAPAAKEGPAAAPASQAHILSRAELDKLLSTPQSVLIVDVRRPDELTRVGGFPVYLSVQLADLEKSLAWIPKDRTIITVSNHAKRAQRAVDLLTSKGYRVAGAAGVQDYEAAGGVLTKIAPPAPKAQTAAK